MKPRGSSQGRIHAETRHAPGRAVIAVRRMRDSGRRLMRRGQEGKWGYILAWLIGVPIPILLLVYLLRGCN